MATIKRVTSFKNLINEEFDNVEVGDINYWKDTNKSIYQDILNKMREDMLDYDWWEPTYELFQSEMKKKFGWAPKTKDMAFSGFWSQGDGASFEGSMDTQEIYKLMRRINKKFELNDAFEDGCVDVSLSFDRSGKYVHEKSVSTNIEMDVTDYERFFELYVKKLQKGECKGIKYYDSDECDDAIYDYVDGFFGELEDTIDEWREDASKELYKMLEGDYEGLTNDEAVHNFCEANGYEFDEYGDIV